MSNGAFYSCRTQQIIKSEKNAINVKQRYPNTKCCCRKEEEEEENDNDARQNGVFLFFFIFVMFVMHFAILFRTHNIHDFLMCFRLLSQLNKRTSMYIDLKLGVLHTVNTHTQQ